MAKKKSDKPVPGHVLTWRQRKMLHFIRETVRTRGYPPSMEEIGDAVGLTSQSSVSYQIATLESRGYLRRDGRKPRTVEVRLPGRPPPRGGHDAGALDIPSQAAVRVPLVARFEAGGPVVAPDRVSAVLPLPAKLVGEDPVFMLTMTDDSMIDAAIADGDWVVVREQTEVASGEIVAVLIGADATVRTFRQVDGHAWLIPNSTGRTPVPAATATILGKVVAILRRLDAGPDQSIG